MACDAECAPVSVGDDLHQLVRSSLSFQRTKPGVCVVEDTEVAPVISGTSVLELVGGDVLDRILVVRVGVIDRSIQIGQWNVELHNRWKPTPEVDRVATVPGA
jgi:hypothetical protein